MASRNRITVDRNLEVAVENAAFGLSITGRPTASRKRRTTLDSISEEMAREAKLIARQQPSRARRSDGGLNKSAPRHPFARSSTGRSTYIKSIEAMPATRSGGRMAISIIAKHGNADDVEYGSARGAVKRVHATGKRFKIPVHEWRYDLLQKSRNLSLKQRRAKGWPSASKEHRKVYSDISNAKRGVVSQRALSAARSKMTARPGKSRVIPMRGRDGRHYISVPSFETYSEYGILRRAMRRIAIRRFE